MYESADAPNRQREKSKSLEKHSIVYFNVKRQYKRVRCDLGFSKFIEDNGVVNRFSEKSKSTEKYNITLEIFENGNAKTPVGTWVFQKLHEGGDAPNRQREKVNCRKKKYCVLLYKTAI